MGEGAWDRALVEFLPRFESAADARTYALDVAELAARIPDGHVVEWRSPSWTRSSARRQRPSPSRYWTGKSW